MISAQGTEEKERGQGREKRHKSKSVQRQKGQQGVQSQVISSLPAVCLQVSLLSGNLTCLDSKWEVQALSEDALIL